MNRRNFIKAFSAVTASVPLATALANTSGTDSVIETFSAKEMQDEVRSFSGGLEISNDGTTGLVNVKENSQIIDFPQNFHYIHVLSYSRSSFDSFIRNNNDLSEFNRMFARRISEPKHLFGVQRGIKIIGLADYWLKTSHQVMITINMRDMEIVTPRQYFNKYMRNQNENI